MSGRTTPQPGLTAALNLCQNESMTNTAPAPTGLIHCTSPDHEGVQRPGNGFFYVAARPRPTYCMDCAAIAPAPRTAQVIRLEIALAKAHYYDSCTDVEANARHDTLEALEAELVALVGEGCEDVAR